MKKGSFSGLFLAAVVALGVSTATVASADGSGWKPYLDLVKKGDGVKYAGIYGQDGSAWSTEPELKLSAQEVKDLVAGIKDNSKFRAKGVVAAGVSYMFLKDLSETSIIARKGPTSFIAITSKKALIVLTTKDGSNPANITSHEFVANDLIKKGF